MDEDLEAALVSINDGGQDAGGSDVSSESVTEWTLSVARPKVTMARAGFVLGESLDTERLTTLMWNVVYVPSKRCVEITDREGHFFTVFNSGKVSVVTTGSMGQGQGIGEVKLRKAARRMARTIQLALKFDQQMTPPTEGLQLADPANVKFLGYNVSNMWATWHFRNYVNTSVTLKNLQAPKYAQSIHSMYATDGISLRLSIRPPLPRMVVLIKPIGAVTFYAAKNEPSILDVAMLLHDEMVFVEKE